MPIEENSQCQLRIRGSVDFGDLARGDPLSGLRTRLKLLEMHVLSFRKAFCFLQD